MFAAGIATVAAIISLLMNWPALAVITLLLAVASATWAGRHLAARSPSSPARSTPSSSATPASPASPHTADPEPQLADLRSVIDAMDEPVLVTGSSGLTELCNAAATRLLGRPAERVLGRPVDELFTQVDVIGLHTAAAGGQARRAHVRISGETGPRYYQVLAAPIAWNAQRENSPNASPPARRGVVLTLRDVTELAMAVNLKTDFVANASHEFRTPLSSIKAAVETLVDGAADEPAMRDRLLRMITGNVTRLEEMTRDLLDLSRLESPETPVEISLVRMAEIAASLKEIFEPACSERRVHLVFELSAGMDELLTDRRLLLLILKNLIDNAIKFAYDGTPIRVTGRLIGAAAADSLEARAAPADAVFEVIDQGLGIPLANQARIFERFYQVDLARSGEPARRGTGLGLAIVKHAVKALGGTVSVQSVWKQGTTMTVELPGIDPLEPADQRSGA